MKKLKKILCLVLCLAVVLTMAFTFAACDRELTEEEKEQLRTELLADSAPDLTRAETVLESSDASTGMKTQMSITWDMSAANANAKAAEAPAFNADIIFVQYNLLDNTVPANVNVIFVRGNFVYGKQVNLELNGSDKLAAAKDKMSELLTGLEKMSMEDLLAELAAETGADLSALGSIDLSGLTAALDAKQLTAFLKEYFTTLSVTDDGFTVAFNTDKVVEQLWDLVYSVAELIDNSRDVTLNMLFNSNDVKNVINQIPLTAAEMEDAINQGIAAFNKQLPTDQQINYTALVAVKNETLYQYLGEYLKIRIDELRTVGDLTIGDLLCLLSQKSTAPDLTDSLDAVKEEVLPQIKETFAAFKCKLLFTKDKKFDGITLDLMGVATINIKTLQSVSLAEIAA